MRRSLLRLTLILVVFGLPLLASSNSIAGKPDPGQGGCTICENFGGCFVCVGAWNGYFSCQAWCDMCVYWTGPGCSPEIENMAKRPADSPRKMTSRVLKAQSKSIRDVAASDPYLALVLLKLREIPIMSESGTLKLSPVAISATDIEDLLDSGRLGSRKFDRLHREAMTVNRSIESGKISPVVYSITVQDFDSAAPVIRIQVEKSPILETLHRVLEMRVTPGEEAGTNTPLWKLEEWRMN